MHLKLVIFISSLFLVSCQTAHDKSVFVDVRAMPPEPEWIVFTRQPIVEKNDNNFVVSDEFVEKALQQKKHLDRIKAWKLENQVP